MLRRGLFSKKKILRFMGHDSVTGPEPIFCWPNTDCSRIVPRVEYSHYYIRMILKTEYLS